MSKEDKLRTYIYIISNPAFPGWLKIGRTSNPEKRLYSYQVYDPNKKFKLEYYVKIQMIAECESYFRKLSKGDSGEWIKMELSCAIEMINIFKDIVYR